MEGLQWAAGGAGSAGGIRGRVCFGSFPSWNRLRLRWELPPVPRGLSQRREVAAATPPRGWHKGDRLGVVSGRGIRRGWSCLQDRGIVWVSWKKSISSCCETKSKGFRTCQGTVGV